MSWRRSSPTWDCPGRGISGILWDDVELQPVAPKTIQVPEVQPSIQAAIDAAQDGDVISVGPGIYREVLDFQAKAIRVGGVLFFVILGLLVAAALLWLPSSDQEVSEAINRGSRRLQEEAIELQREGRAALKETREEINKRSEGLREQSGRLREEISKTGREQLEPLREQTGGRGRKRSRRSQRRHTG